MLLKRWPTGAAGGGCRGRRGESRGWGPVLGKRQGDDGDRRFCNYLRAATSSAFISKLRLDCFLRVRSAAPCPNVNSLCLCACVFLVCLLDWLHSFLCLQSGTSGYDWGRGSIQFHAQTSPDFWTCSRAGGGGQKWRGVCVCRALTR